MITGYVLRRSPPREDGARYFVFGGPCSKLLHKPLGQVGPDVFDTYDSALRQRNTLIDREAWAILTEAEAARLDEKEGRR